MIDTVVISGCSVVFGTLVGVFVFSGMLSELLMRGCEGDGNAGVGSGGCVVPVSAYTRGSGVLSSACDVLEMSVVRGVGGWLGVVWKVCWE